MVFFFFECAGDHRDIHVRTHAFPTRRSSDLDAKDVIESLELAGFVIVPQMPTEQMVAAADQTLSKGLMGSGSRTYVTAVWGAMNAAWLDSRNSNQIGRAHV